MSAVILISGVLAVGSLPVHAAAPLLSSTAQIVVHITPQGEVRQLAIDPTHTATIYAGTDAAGIYRSDNGGATWQLAAKGLPDKVAIGGLLVDPSHHRTVYAATEQGVYQTSNQGGRWVSEGPPTSSGSTTLALNPTNSATIYAGTAGDGIYRSLNHGATWSAIGPRLTTINAVAVDPTGSTIYAGTSDGLLISPKRGVWQRAGLGHVNVQALGLGTSNSSVLYAGYENGVLLSRDGGISWARAGLTQRSISTIYVDPSDAGRAYAASVATGGLFLSTNYGHSWLPLVAGLSTDRVSALAIDPTDARIAYAGLNPGVFKSLQGGRSWASSSIYDRSVRAVLQPAVKSGTFFAGTNAGVYTSHDAGEVWTSAGLGNHTVSALLPLGGALIAATESGIYRTSDGGHLWPHTLKVPAYALMLDRAQPGALYAGTRSGLFHSGDGGVSWSQLSAGTDPVYALITRDDGALVAGGAAGVMLSTDHGASFKRYAVNNQAVSQLLARPAPEIQKTVLYARTDQGQLYRSLDGGVTWTNSSVGQLATSALTLGHDKLLYAATGQGIYRSSSGGISWVLTDQQDTTLSPLVLQPAIDNSSTTLLEGLDGQGVLVRTLHTTPASPFAPLAVGTVGQYFPTTGHFVRAPFLDWYLNNNGTQVLGAPRTEQLHIKGQLVQYFQNALLVYQPSLANTPHVIALSPLGQQSVTVSTAPIPGFDNTTVRWFFPQTGHSLSGEFRQYWRQFGGADVFGFPITEPVTVQGVVVQYFQNVRLEAYPAAGNQFFHTRVTPLGDQALRQLGWLQ